ncbi:MAG: hypothetical protein LBU32_00555 [Clostridiales bacterium]|nr:hypothetical protein [Clostridiales bacterium]
MLAAAVLVGQPKLPLGRCDVQEYTGAPGRLLRILRLAAEQALTGGDRAASMQSLGTALAEGGQPRQCRINGAHSSPA